MRNFLFLFMISTLLAACGSSLITPRAFDPVIEDTVGAFGQSDIGIIATTASRRAIAFRNVPDGAEPGQRITVEFCPEPPPDAIDQVFQDFSASLAGSIDSTEITEAKFNNILNLTNQILFQRSQGVQLLRDGMYNVCILYMNRILTKEKISIIVQSLITQSAELIKLEIERGKVIGEAQAAASAAIIREERRDEESQEQSSEEDQAAVGSSNQPAAEESRS